MDEASHAHGSVDPASNAPLTCGRRDDSPTPNRGVFPWDR
jgi:hypothetical protein